MHTNNNDKGRVGANLCVTDQHRADSYRGCWAEKVLDLPQGFGFSFSRTAKSPCTCGPTSNGNYITWRVFCCYGWFDHGHQNYFWDIGKQLILWTWRNRGIWWHRLREFYNETGNIEDGAGWCAKWKRQGSHLQGSDVLKFKASLALSFQSCTPTSTISEVDRQQHLKKCRRCAVMAEGGYCCLYPPQFIGLRCFTTLSCQKTSNNLTFLSSFQMLK